MRTSLLSVIALASLLILAGCAGLPSTGQNQPSPEAFPNASEINSSVLDRHATELTNRSFTLETETTRKERLPSHREENLTYMNSSFRFLVEPSDSQYLVYTDGYFAGNATIYSDGSTEYALYPDNRTPVRKLGPGSVFNESGDRYLWRGWFANDSGSLSMLAVVGADATYQREGIETYQGVPIMRYEATGVDALPDWTAGGDPSSWYENFSATLLLDENGVIRYYEYEFVWADYHTRRLTETYALSDVGSTDVQKPDWVANTTSGA